MMHRRRKPRISGVAVVLILITAVVSVKLTLLVANKPLEECVDYPVVLEETVEDIPSSMSSIETAGDINNYIYPFNTMSTDWGADIYESGFKYYQLPQSYVNTGGCFPEVVQVYLWSLCQEKNIDYYMVVALIERESGYKWNATSNNGTVMGYMQIYEKWHKDRMQAEGVDDIYNPYGNISVGLNILQELIGKYGEDYHKILMSYNMGEAGCRKANNRGIYSTEYSRGILQRAKELEQEIQG